jgi:hypothetical protein
VGYNPGTKSIILSERMIHRAAQAEEAPGGSVRQAQHFT